MKSNLVSFISGGLFALGLGISGMTQPAIVVGFLDVFGNWDPSLVFVLASAVGVYFLMFQIVKTQQKPVFASKFNIPTRKDIDSPLIIGAALFGMGWGLSGLCPGTALTSLFTNSTSILGFVISMSLGIFTMGILLKMKTKLALFA